MRQVPGELVTRRDGVAVRRLLDRFVADFEGSGSSTPRTCVSTVLAASGESVFAAAASTSPDATASRKAERASSGPSPEHPAVVAATSSSAASAPRRRRALMAG
ncbi:hypothetical protein [Amycolatopsis australiensis]|uniref:hypothetical protein n=1 Tax=Amycolatopsis australiensis TaxID=546364 RepID=UPI001FECE619|nr:hypothetical protein [Amycolatopsis australiensis]